MARLILATRNPGKIAELTDLLHDLPFEILPQNQWAIPEIEETGLTFIENALLKARHVARITQTSVLADDSGLVVPALQGEPGLYSARYAGPSADARANQQKLLAKLAHYTQNERAAYFYCCIVYLRHPQDPTPLIAEGFWHGMIAASPQGAQGFGYDPLFYLPQQACTAAQLPFSEKNRLSHRGKALSLLKKKLRMVLAAGS